jgi:pyrroloquinoline quinone (PQQ) biosynthesis protein C
MTPSEFVKALRKEVLAHPAVNHRLLARAERGEFTREQWREFGLQLYPHCHLFITYMELLLLNARDAASKICLAKILLDEYGEDAGGQDHPMLFHKFLAASGISDAEIMDTPLEPTIVNMVRRHVELNSKEPFLVGLGSIGPATELTLPAMWPQLCAGMRKAGYSDDDVIFFTLHSDHDVEHANMMDESVAQLAVDEKKQALVRQGALASLEARNKFWDAIERRMDDPSSRRGETSLNDLVGLPRGTAWNAELTYLIDQRAL